MCRAGARHLIVRTKVVQYEGTIDYLVGLEATRGWDLKLERVRAALAALGAPDRAYPSVLIAGTNGKGSTAAMVQAALGATGRKIGLYTSPHLVAFTERIRIGAREIERADVVAGVEHIRRHVDVEGTGLTFFEVTTVLALHAFAEARVDAAVLEVGLGGRLDATNVVEPVASVVTSIGFDHEDYLGSTLDAIAREKAGVMRRGRVTLLGPDLGPEARAALLDEGARRGARIVETVAPPSDALALGCAYMRRNAAVACGLVEAVGAAEPRLRVSDPAAVARAIGSVRWPGRLSVVHSEPTVVLDGAHNVDGARALREALASVTGGGPVRLLFSALRDKRWREMAAELAPLASEVVVAEIGGKRGLAATELTTAFAPTPRIVADPADALARLIAEDRAAPILVTGSLFLVGMIYADLMRQSGTSSVFDFRPAGVSA